MTRIDPAAARIRARLRAGCAEQDRQLRAAAAAARMEPPRLPGPVTPAQWPDASWGRCKVCSGEGYSEEKRLSCPTCGNTGRALPADREPRFVAWMAETWAAAGKGPNEGVGTCRWCGGDGALYHAKANSFRNRACPRCVEQGYGESTQRPARNLAPVAARLLLAAARRAPANPVHAALLAEAVQGKQVTRCQCDAGNGWFVHDEEVRCVDCDDTGEIESGHPETACHQLLADLSGGNYTARPDRDLPVLRMLVGLQGEAGEVLRWIGQGHGIAVIRSTPTPAQALLIAVGAARLGENERTEAGVYQAGVFHTPRGLALARALWGGCRMAPVYREVNYPCTLVAGHAGGCRWEGGAVGTADGFNLDTLASVNYGLHRADGETDAELRARIHAAADVVIGEDGEPAVQHGLDAVRASIAARLRGGR
jgi:hypothetical protein